MAILLFSPIVMSADRLLMSHAGMDAYLLNLDCRSNLTAKIDVRSRAPGVFDGERIELQRLIAQVRAVVSIECPNLRRITAKGTINNRLYFAGATDKAWGWRIIGLYAAPPN